jgi:hypothetical protein
MRTRREMLVKLRCLHNWFLRGLQFFIGWEEVEFGDLTPVVVRQFTVLWRYTTLLRVSFNQGLGFTLNLKSGFPVTGFALVLWAWRRVASLRLTHRP